MQIFQNCLKFHSPKAREVLYNNFELLCVVFMPNITTNHAIIYLYKYFADLNTNKLYNSGDLGKKGLPKPLEIGTSDMKISKNVKYVSHGILFLFGKGAN